MGIKNIGVKVRGPKDMPKKIKDVKWLKALSHNDFKIGGGALKA